MNLQKIFSRISNPPPKSNPQEEPDDSSAREYAKEMEREERQKWIESIFTQRLLTYIESSKEELNEQAIAFSSSVEQLDEANQIVARKMQQLSTLKEIENYVRTGKN